MELEAGRCAHRAASSAISEFRPPGLRRRAGTWPVRRAQNLIPNERVPVQSGVAVQVRSRSSRRGWRSPEYPSRSPTRCREKGSGPCPCGPRRSEAQMMEHRLGALFQFSLVLQATRQQPGPSKGRRPPCAFASGMVARRLAPGRGGPQARGRCACTQCTRIGVHVRSRCVSQARDYGRTGE